MDALLAPATLTQEPLYDRDKAADIFTPGHADISITVGICSIIGVYYADISIIGYLYLAEVQLQILGPAMGRVYVSISEQPGEDRRQGHGLTNSWES